MNKSDRTAFLPVSKEDMAVRGIEQLDFVYISGDAYVDHPSFGTAIISKQTVSRSALSHSRTGATPKACAHSASQNLAFSFPPAIWIPW